MTHLVKQKVNCRFTEIERRFRICDRIVLVAQTHDLFSREGSFSTSMQEQGVGLEQETERRIVGCVARHVRYLSLEGCAAR